MGVTPFDHLSCRIQWADSRYDGMYTLPNTTNSLVYPSWFRGMNWGSVAIDEDRALLIVNDMRITINTRLIPNGEQIEGVDLGQLDEGGSHGTGILPQLGTPFAVDAGSMVSFLGIPCKTPP